MEGGVVSRLDQFLDLSPFIFVHTTVISNTKQEEEEEEIVGSTWPYLRVRTDIMFGLHAPGGRTKSPDPSAERAAIT